MSLPIGGPKTQRVLKKLVKITPISWKDDFRLSYYSSYKAVPFVSGVQIFLLGPLCYKLITIVNCYLEAGLTCFVYCPKALYLIIFIVWHSFCD